MTQKHIDTLRYAVCPTEYIHLASGVLAVAPFKIVDSVEEAVFEVARLHRSFGFDIVPIDTASRKTVNTTPSMVRSYKADAYKVVGSRIYAYDSPLYDWARTAFDAWCAGNKKKLYYSYERPQ